METKCGDMLPRHSAGALGWKQIMRVSGETDHALLRVRTQMDLQEVSVKARLLNEMSAG